KASCRHVRRLRAWALFLREAERLGSDEAAAESVKKKFLGELCRDDEDLARYSVLPFTIILCTMQSRKCRHLGIIRWGTEDVLF
ncbi:MAG: hypothetical protein WKF77_19075, partial [Planctomycetaceae bacterium]